MFILKYTYDLESFVNICFLNFVVPKSHQMWIFLFFSLLVQMTLNQKCMFKLCAHLHVLEEWPFRMFFCFFLVLTLINWLQGWLFDLASFEFLLPIWSDGKNDPEPPGLLTTKHASWHHVQLALKENLIWQKFRGPSVTHAKVVFIKYLWTTQCAGGIVVGWKSKNRINAILIE